jgi:diguanylate cyclase (GGDEF)-like protein
MRIEALRQGTLPRPRLDDPAPRSAAGRILAVEEDAVHGAALRDVLQGAGHELWICQDPRRFAGELGRVRPDLVLMSALASGTSGYALLRWLRRQERYATLPALVLATRGELAARIETARAGGDDHLVKPVPSELLLSAVEGRLERSRYLKDLLNQDALTGLLHGPALIERAHEHVERQRLAPGHRAVWAIIDLDHFKAVNDRHGHAAGDSVLVALAALLRRHVRQGDSLGRCGGEEFAILIDGASEEAAAGVVERLRREFAGIAHAAAAGSVFQSTFSAGLAALRRGMTLLAWREAADRALYAAKDGGRNRVAVGPAALGRAPLAPPAPPARPARYRAAVSSPRAGGPR